MLVPAATVTARGQGVTAMPPNALLTTQVVVDMLGIRGVSVLVRRSRKLRRRQYGRWTLRIPWLPRMYPRLHERGRSPGLAISMALARRVRVLPVLVGQPGRIPCITGGTDSEEQPTYETGSRRAWPEARHMVPASLTQGRPRSSLARTKCQISECELVSTRSRAALAMRSPAAQLICEGPSRPAGGGCHAGSG